VLVRRRRDRGCRSVDHDVLQRCTLTVELVSMECARAMFDTLMGRVSYGAAGVLNSAVASFARLRASFSLSRFAIADPCGLLSA
jgi:hypothetical protein